MKADRSSEVVRAARAWLGTPYRHQASNRGAGADCLGLVRGIWREVVGPEIETVPPYTRDWGEASGCELLWTAASRILSEKQDCDPEVGDVLLFRMRSGGVAKHLGIVSSLEPGAFIHAYSKHGVVESALTEAWRTRLVACFSFPDGVY